MKFSFREHLSIAVSFMVSAGLMIWLIARMDFARAVHLLRQAQGPWLVLAVCLAVLIPLCGTCRWMGVLHACGNFKFPVTAAWRGVMFSYALNSFLPSKAGDFAKALYFRNTGGIALGVGAVILERLSDLLILGALGMTAGLISLNVWGTAIGVVLFSEARWPLPLSFV